MSNYRRNIVPGGTYFFTVNLENRGSTLLVDEIDLLRRSVVRVRQIAPFDVEAWVVLPDHMHAIWTLPPGDANYSRRWRAIKDLFSRSILPGERLSDSRKSQGERGIWQRRYWEHTIRDARDLAAHMDYTHFNPVKHGLVEDVSTWPYSSFRRCVERGYYPRNWAGSTLTITANGER